MKLVTRWCLSALTLLVLAEVVPGIVVSGVGVAFVAALVLGLLNAAVRPIILVLTLPVTILTLGLFLFVINTVFFALAAWLVPGFTVSGVLSALVGAVGMSVSALIVQRLLR